MRMKSYHANSGGGLASLPGRASMSKTRLWTGRVLDAWLVLFLAFDAGVKVLRLSVAVEGTTRLGYPEEQVVILGIVDFGLLFQRYEVLTNATREGARLAVLPGYSSTDVKMRVCDYLLTGGVPAPGCDPFADPAWITVTNGTIAVGGGKNIDVKRVQLAYSHSYSFIGPIIALMGGSWNSNKTINTLAVMRNELTEPTP